MQQLQHSQAGPSEGELFKKTLGPEWRKLHPDIRNRFGKNPSSARRLRYTGILREEASGRRGIEPAWMGARRRPFLFGKRYAAPGSRTEICPQSKGMYLGASHSK